MLIAPPGFGKTTAIIGYLRHSGSTGLYCSLDLGASDADVWQAIGNAVHGDDAVACASHDDVMRLLGSLTPIELALDFDGAPDADGIAAINHIIDELPEGISLLIAGRSRTNLDAGRLVTRGMASLCDADRLAFDAAEVRHLAEACKVPFTEIDIRRVLEATDGWPLVVSGAIRKAAEDGCNLSAAVENWRTRHGHLFTEFITSALENTPPAESEVVRQLMSGATVRDQQQLWALEMEGLFVIHDSHGYRPLRALSKIRTNRRVVAPQPRNITPLHVRMFGRFRAEIDDRPIEWVRRRDQQIFKFIALSRSGSVTRSELGQTFWPEAEKHLVAQSLRTACCNIRKAIARIVGYDYVDGYFRADHTRVSLDLNNVIVDVSRFLAHANDGQQQYERNDLRAAYAHYRAAEQLYWGDLLAGEAVEPWTTMQAAMLEGRHIMVLERVAELAVELGDYGSGVVYARRVAEIKPDSESAKRLLEQATRQASQHQDASAEDRNESSPIRLFAQG